MPLAPFSHNSVFLRRQVTFIHLVDVDFFVDAESLEPTAGMDVGESATLANALFASPRSLLFTLTDAASDTLDATFKVVGKDQFGRVVEESITIDYNTAATGETNYAYSEVTSITMTAVNNAAASDTLDVGVGTKYGLPFKLTNANQVKSITQSDAGVPVNVVASSSTVSIAYNTVDISAAGEAAADQFVVDLELHPDAPGTLR